MTLPVSAWGSTRPLAPVAAHLGGEAALVEWMAEEAARAGDPAFTELFSGAARALKLPLGLFAQRHLPSLLGGIRFFGGDVTRPFVEVIAHDLPLETLRATVRREWADFAPRAFRLLVPGDHSMPCETCLDQTVHIARAGTIAQAGATLALFDGPETAQVILDAAFAASRVDPGFAGAVNPTDDLPALFDAERLHAILYQGVPVGLIATRPGRIAWIDGEIVQELAVHPDHRGRGLAAAGHRALAATFSPERPYMGTIAAQNPASRKSAERSGRPAALKWVFVPIDPTRRGVIP